VVDVGEYGLALEDLAANQGMSESCEIRSTKTVGAYVLDLEAKLGPNCI
jgi:hypothetical protein